METTKILHIWTNHHTSGRWYSHNRENCRTRNRIWYIHLQWCWSRKLQHLSKLVLVLYSQSAVLQSLQLLQNLSLEPPYSMERQKNPSLLRLQKILQQLHYLEQELLKEDSKLVGSGTLTLSNDQRVVTGIILSPTGSGTFSILGGAASNSRTICCKKNSYRYHRCCRNKILPSIPRLRSIWYIHIIWRTHTSRDRLHTKVHWIWNYYNLWICRRGGSCQRDWCWYCNLLWCSRCQNHSRRSGRNSPLRYKRLLLSPHSIKFTDTTETTEIQTHLVLLQSLVLVLQNQYKSLVTTETTKILTHRVDLHSPILLSYTHLSITHLRLALVLQSFIRQVEQARILHLRQLRDSRKIQRTCWI